MNRAGDLFGLLLLFLLSGCRGSLSDSGGKKAVGAQIDATVVPSFLQQRVHPHSSDSSCIQRQESVDKPFWLPEQGIVITRLLSMCLAPSGHYGYRVDTAWTGMSLPCVQGNGRIQWRGGRGSMMSMLALDLADQCLLSQAQKRAVVGAAAAALNFDPASKLIAIHPMTVQLWKIPSLKVSGVGDVIQLNESKSVQEFKKLLRRRDTLGVELFGRENSWNGRSTVYQIQASIQFHGGDVFQLSIAAVKVMEPEELRSLRNYCSSIHHASQCLKLF